MDENTEPKPAQIVGKLTAKFGADPKKVADAPNGRLWLCDLFGRGLSLKQGLDKRTDNPWTSILGKFEAYYPETGETYQSGKLFLPGGIQDVLEAAIAQLPDDPMASVDFAFRIFAVKAANNFGYTYEAQPLIDMSQNDGLNNLRSIVENRRARERKARIDPTIPPQTEPAAGQVAATGQAPEPDQAAAGQAPELPESRGELFIPNGEPDQAAAGQAPEPEPEPETRRGRPASNKQHKR